MSLREDIKEIFPSWNTAVQMNDPRLELIISKVLDAAVEAVLESNYPPEGDAIKAIQRLKEGE